MRQSTKVKQLVVFQKFTAWVLVFTLLLAICPARVQAAEAGEGKELNIYAIYLKSEKKGDCVLLESKGEYLLIDMGKTDHISTIIKQLKLLGVTHLNIMFSHLHTDHIGGSNANPAYGLKKLTAAGIHVDTLYLPDPMLAASSVSYLKVYAGLQTYMGELEGGQIVYLNVGSQLNVGDATGFVIGPVDTDQISPASYKNMAESEQYIRYENNCSLVVMFNCGGVRYLTAGDIYTDQANFLVQKYGDALRSDIMKLSHHGTGGGNSVELLDKVQPTYTFACNTAYTAVKADTRKWTTYTSMSRASKYSMCYLVGNEKKTLIYHIEDGMVTLYRGETVADGKKLTGWQTFYGADGTYRDHERYYFDSEGQPVSGLRAVGDNVYYFSACGRMGYGSFDTDGVYNGWVTYEDGRRYYKLSDNREYAYPMMGFTKLREGYYYFKPDGCVVASEIEDSKQIIQIDTDCYCIDPSGEIWCDEWYEKDERWYYFGKDGTMKRNQVCKAGDEYYIFTGDGSIVMAKDKVELYKFGSESYLVSKNGYLLRSQCRAVNGVKYCVDDKGVVQKDKLVVLDGNYYYFDKDGKMVKNKTVKVSGKTYRCNQQGIASYVAG